MNCKILIGVACLLLLLGVLWFLRKKSSPSGETKENFTWANNIRENPGPYTPTYDLVQQDAPDIDAFANFVEPVGNAVGQNQGQGMIPTPSVVQYDYKDLLPDLNTNVAMYDKDISDPEVFMWRPSVRVDMKNRQQAGADPFRGDLPIQKNNCYGSGGWFQSRYGPGDNNLNGIFNELYQEKYRALTGQKSYNIAIANEETVCDSYPQEDQMFVASDVN
ncbi:hypothetical protein A9K97_gp135 [Tokyovirus A1]|uniref:hypothetical protein n=1 Tax=Tokyovirus A1 TaxID=1826170 RepID=UPI0007A96FC1|nr:hypothetical protein A9K97_gp135 [Tokyovirus A1]BAU80216.1 hypothetical protein [Tokyovirus A1]